jgi:hypothetical protein
MLVGVATDIDFASVLIVEEVEAVVARTRKTGTSTDKQKSLQRKLLFQIYLDSQMSFDKSLDHVLMMLVVVGN